MTDVIANVSLALTGVVMSWSDKIWLIGWGLILILLFLAAYALHRSYTGNMG